MTRAEFDKPTKRAALKRSGNLCEATGILYGLAPETRCNAPLSRGFQFDHLLAASNGGDNSLGNCVCACIKCHKYKTTKHDTPRAAKTVRQQDKNNGIVTPKAAISKRPFQSRLKSNDKFSRIASNHKAHLEKMSLKGRTWAKNI